MTDHLLSRGRGSRRLPLVNPHTVVLNLNSVLAVFPHAANGPSRLEEDPGFCVGRARPASFRNSQAVNNDEDFISSLGELYLDLFIVMLASIISLPVLLVEQARTEQPQHQKELAVKFAML